MIIYCLTLYIMTDYNTMAEINDTMIAIVYIELQNLALFCGQSTMACGCLWHKLSTCRNVNVWFYIVRYILSSCDKDITHLNTKNSLNG